MQASQDKQLKSYCHETAGNAKAAASLLSTLSTETKNGWLLSCAEKLPLALPAILEANRRDIEAAQESSLTDASLDRLRLDESRVSAIAQGLREIAALTDPVGETISGGWRPNGLEIRKVRVPLGTVFFIYESRPNVTVDAAAICVKSGNSVILRGGKEARHSSQALVNVLTEAAQQHGIPEHAVQLVNTTDRAAVGYFLALSESIDVAIPRGGKGLIERVVRDAHMPVIKHFDGNCHVYVDSAADLDMAERIVVNSKCQRLGVCNACESLVVHSEIAETFLPQVAQALCSHGIELRGDQRACKLISQAFAASDADWRAEYLGPVISIKVVDSLQEAIEHINYYGSHHTDAIVTNRLQAADEFLWRIDSSAVIVNASTRFNDGGEFGLGAEIGISTDKFHARGPCGLQELTTYKYLVSGRGQVR